MTLKTVLLSHRSQGEHAPSIILVTSVTALLYLWTRWMIYFLRLIKETENLIIVTGMALSSTSQGRCYQVLLEAMPLNPLDLL